MTLVSRIIYRAFRSSNLIAAGTQPTVDEQTEALEYLNSLLKSVFGNEVGDPLSAFPIGRANINRPSGYPWWDDVPDNDWFVPKNVRLVFNLTKPIDIYLHPNPDGGSRFACIDSGGSLSSTPVTVHGNGYLIEGQQSILLDQDEYDAEWFFREDLGDWLRYAPLGLEDTFPFPEEFDDFFVILLAIRLNPSYGINLDPQSDLILRRARTQLRARYTQNIPTPSDLALLRLAKVAADRDRWGNSYWLYNPSDMFSKGWPW